MVRACDDESFATGDVSGVAVTDGAEMACISSTPGVAGETSLVARVGELNDDAMTEADRAEGESTVNAMTAKTQRPSPKERRR